MFTILTKQTLDQIGLIVKGIPVYVAFHGQPAYAAGVRQGDVIIEVNGIKTPTPEHYVRAIQADVDGKRKVRVWRAGSELNFTIDLVSDLATGLKDAVHAMQQSEFDEFLTASSKENTGSHN